jgi:CheY-like chemotaxis protein
MRETPGITNILIVDDDLDTVELSRHLLESAGHHVKTGHTGIEGLRSLHTKPLPDCILLDVDMPMLSGPGMAHQMLLHDTGEEDIPIILVSGRDDLPEIAARMGTPYFLRKASHNYGKVLLQIVARALVERLAPASA